MKKGGIAVITVAILVILSIAASLSLTYPHSERISSVVQAVEFRLGGKSEDVTPVSVHVDGTLDYSLTGKMIFKGTIRVEGDGFTDPNANRPLRMRFYKNESGVTAYAMDYEQIIFTGPDSSKPEFSNPKYGMVFASSDFASVTIQVKENGWNSGTGLLIGGPADNRTDALKLAKQVIGDGLNGAIIE